MDASLPKSPYKNVKMVVYFDIVDLVGNYIVVNELKSPYKNKPF
jgi:sporulation protein YlmC with PRC-barrel domain